MRPFTADENFFFLTGNVWKQKSASPKSSLDNGLRQVRNLMITSNVHTFIENSTIRLEAESLNSMRDVGKKEIIDELNIIKNKYNITQKRFSVDDTRLKKLQKIAHERSVEERVGTYRSQYIQTCINKLYQSIEYTRHQQEECIQDMKIYEHILERSKKSAVFLEIKANSLKGKIRKMNLEFEGEKKTKLKVIESKSCSQRIYKMLHEVVANETKDKQSVVEKISRDFDMRDILKIRREERKRRYAEISENAANEDKDKKEAYLKEGVYLYRMWANYLLTKFAYDRQKYSNIEMAFQKIHAATGEYNVNELVHKFLTREQTFKELKYTIDLSRTSIEQLYKRNGEIESVIHAVEIYDKESRTQDIFTLREKHLMSFKELETEKLKLKNLVSIREHINEWNKRLLKIFDVDYKKHFATKKLFELLAVVIKNKLKGHRESASNDNL